jgi:hypothetical protein
VYRSDVSTTYTVILVVVDQLTRMAIDLACHKDVDSPELAGIFFEEVIANMASRATSSPIEALKSRAGSGAGCAHI